LHKIITPIQTLLLGFIVLILLGSILLWLPVSATQDQSTSFIDALFTAASAVTTTGLVVVDTGSHYTLFGQLVILLLFQIGGLGYMLFIALISFGIGTGFTIGGRLVFTESVARPITIEIKKFVKAVFLYAAAFEFAGATLLTLVFLSRLSFVEAVYSAIFHSVSAFCTAGFSLYADSFTAYANSLPANAVIAFVTIGGGIGFFVLYDITSVWRRFIRSQYPMKLSDHSKLVLLVSFLLMATGTFALFLIEGDDNATSNFSDRFLTASFQALSASTTTGFNTVDIGSMHSLSLVYIIVLMFIGASPGSTGGGIKTTSFGIIFLFIRSVLTNRPEVSAFRRTIQTSTVHKALGLALLASLYLTILVLSLSISEQSSLLAIIFEATSALGTVGLSTGVTPTLTTTGKILIIITMFIGRVGPLAIGYSLVGKPRSKTYSYPTGNVMVG
jgi:trk system potassium uptake protein